MFDNKYHNHSNAIIVPIHREYPILRNALYNNHVWTGDSTRGSALRIQKTSLTCNTSSTLANMALLHRANQRGTLTVVLLPDTAGLLSLQFWGCV